MSKNRTCIFCRFNNKKVNVQLVKQLISCTWNICTHKKCCNIFSLVFMRLFCCLFTSSSLFLCIFLLSHYPSLFSFSFSFSLFLSLSLALSPPLCPSFFFIFLPLSLSLSPSLSIPLYISLSLKRRNSARNKTI